jgi:hypothetical protein
MPYKFKQTKGVQPLKRKTDRRLIPTDIRFAILSHFDEGISKCAIGTKFKKDPRTVFRIIKKAGERAEANNRLFLDQLNVQDTPRKWAKKPMFTENDKENIASEVTLSRENREISALFKVVLK